ncbi:MAG: DUF5702 domain-containing protein [Lachnospiraceae bacterium]|nr:DUF5702 domain-containing protein [Lachnospiraceae bacterium]
MKRILDKMIVIMKNNRKKGSITVFLTLIFVVIFVLISAFIEITRIKTAESYSAVAAKASVICAFGSYNKELRDDYHLYAYGGFDGKNYMDLQFFLNGILADNLADSDNEFKSDKFFSTKYTSLYQFEKPGFIVEEAKSLTDYSELMRQVRVYAATDSIDEIKDRLFNASSSENEDESDKLSSSLKEAKDYKEKQDDNSNADSKNSNEADSSNGSKKSNGKKNNSNGNLKDDEAKGNPLTAFGSLMRDGILSLVCEPNSLPNKKLKIEKIDPTLKEDEFNKKFSKDLYKDLDVNDGFQNTEIIEKINNSSNDAKEEDENIVDSISSRAAYICWAQDFLTSYLEDKNKYCQIEYVICGSNSVRNSILNIASRLILIRIAANMAYVYNDASLSAKAMETATVIGGLTFTEELIEVYKDIILFILAYEESLIDVCALMDGRIVPLVKDSESFKLNYGEICLVTKALIRQKAEEFPEKGGSEGVSGLNSYMKGGFSYTDYLNLFLCMISKKKLTIRTCEIIQYDLQNKYNQTFTIDNSISSFKGKVEYELPLIYSGIYGEELFKILKKEDTNNGNLQKSFDVEYAYMQYETQRSLN